MSTLRDLIEQHRVANDPSATARNVLSALKVSKNAAEVLHSAVRDHVILYERSLVVPIERAIRRDGVRAVTANELHEASFYTGIGDRWASWSEATVEDHKGAEEYNRGRGDAFYKVADRHRWAITQIESHDVACLGEIVDVA